MNIGIQWHFLLLWFLYINISINWLNPETKNFGMFFATASLLIWSLKQRQLHLLFWKILFLQLLCHFHLICWSLTYVWSIWFWFICLLSIYFSIMFLCSRGFKVVTTNYIFCDTKQTAKNKLYLLYHLVFRWTNPLCIYEILITYTNVSIIYTSNK